MHRPSRILIIIAITLCFAATARSDIKIKVRSTENNQTSETLIYFKDARQRDEFSYVRKGRLQGTAFIYQCDLRQVVWVDHANRKYYLIAREPLSSTFAFNEVRSLLDQPQVIALNNGSLIETVIVTDTGERKEMFGYLARHIKTKKVWDASPACDHVKVREETDGWYIDLLYGVECSPDLSGTNNRPSPIPQSKCFDYYNKHHYQFQRKQIGTARFGFPLLLTVKAYTDDGNVSTATREILDIVKTDLDSSLFDIPAGYAEAKLPSYKESWFDWVLSFFRWR